jgi:uncharacterized protein (TIGR02996 family)
MSDESALLRAIWDEPHDDTLRLVYADWCEEHGNAPRAEFIRTQIELTRIDEDDPRRSALEQREAQLIRKHGKVWKAGLPTVVRNRSGFERGFPSPALRELVVGKFIALPADELATAPLWKFHIPPNARKFSDLIASPNLLRVEVLAVRFWLETPEHVRRFVSSPHLRNVANLGISISRLGEEGGVALAAGLGALPNLRRLDLSSTWVGDRTAAALAAAPEAKGLRALDLSQNDKFTGDGLVALCSSPHLVGLEELTLAWFSPDTEALAAVAATRPAFRLRTLRIDIPTNEGLAALARWPGLASIRDLNLTMCYRLGRAGLTALAESPNAVGLRALRIAVPEQGTGGYGWLAVLARSPHLAGLRTLSVLQWLCKIDAPTVALLRERFGDGLELR